MPEFLIRLLIVVLVLYLLQIILGVLELREPAPKIIFAITLILGIVYLVVGSLLPTPIR